MALLDFQIIAFGLFFFTFYAVSSLFWNWGYINQVIYCVVFTSAQMTFLFLGLAEVQQRKKGGHNLQDHWTRSRSAP